MNRIDACFQRLRENGERAFIPYIMGGDPDLEATVNLVDRLGAAGADLIEIGVPFSDPLADGPVIQQAAVRALHNGVTLNRLLGAVAAAGSRREVPLVLMIYYNMILARGVESFCSAAHEAGCAGLIVPDLPPEEAGQLVALADRYQLELNFLVAPTSSGERIERAVAATTGFVYAVSVKGVTGARNELAPDLPELVRRIRSRTTKPVAVGFGIATPEQAGTVATFADGVIVGSAMVSAVASDPSLLAAEKLARDLKAGIRTGTGK